MPPCLRGIVADTIHGVGRPSRKLSRKKTAQKKVRDALDTAREEVVKSAPATLEAFISSWIQGTIEHMAKAGGNPKSSLSEADAVRLFDTMVQEGGGLPLQLAAAGGTPPRGWPEVTNAVALVYANYPDVGGMAGGMGGKGYGGGYNPMAAMGGFNPMMGKGGYGYAPY